MLRESSQRESSQVKADGSRLRFHYGLVILVMGFLAVLGSLGFGRFSFGMILPGMSQALDLTRSQAGLLLTLAFAGYVISSFTSGLLVARYGARRILSAGMIVTAAGLLVTGMATGLVAAALGQILTGLGSGTAYIPGVSLATTWFHTSRRGMASGVMAMGCGIGLVTAGLVVPAIFGIFGAGGWRVSWYFYALATLAVAVVEYLFVRNSPAEMGLLPFGAPGTVARSDSSVSGPPGPGQGTNPLLQLGSVARIGGLWHLGLIYCMFGFSYIIFVSFFASYLLEIGFSTRGAGDLWAAVGVISVPSGLIWGLISDRLGRKWALALTYAVQGTCLGLLSQGLLVSWAALAYGLTLWSIPAIATAACGDYAGPRLAPAAISLITLVFAVGQMTGPPAAGLLADATGNFAGAFALAAGVALAGAVGAAWLKREN